MLVAAVLRPEDGEDGELEVVRRSFEQVVDPLEFPVRETERSMKLLLVDRGQKASLAAASDGPSGGRFRIRRSVNTLPRRPRLASPTCRHFEIPHRSPNDNVR